MNAELSTVPSHLCTRWQACPAQRSLHGFTEMLLKKGKQSRKHTPMPITREVPMFVRNKPFLVQPAGQGIREDRSMKACHNG